MKEKMDGVSKEMLASIARIRKDKELRSFVNDDGVDVDDDESGLTKLKPSGNRGRRGGRGREDYGVRGDYRDREFEGEARDKRGGRGGAQTARPRIREKLTDNTESFPNLD